MTKPSWIIRPGGLAEDDKAEILRLAERQWKCSPIARRIEKHPATVRWFMLTQGLIKDSGRRAVASVRNGVAIVPFTPEEDDFIRARRLEGLTPRQIADLLNEQFARSRKGHSIQVRLVMLASFEEAAA